MPFIRPTPNKPCKPDTDQTTFGDPGAKSRIRVRTHDQVLRWSIWR